MIIYRHINAEKKTRDNSLLMLTTLGLLNSMIIFAIFRMKGRPSKISSVHIRIKLRMTYRDLRGRMKSTRLISRGIKLL